MIGVGMMWLHSCCAISKYRRRQCHEHTAEVFGEKVRVGKWAEIPSNDTGSLREVV